MKKLFLALIVLAAFPASAQVLVETHPQEGSSIEIGVGGLKNGPDWKDSDPHAQDVQFLIRVSGSALTRTHTRAGEDTTFYMIGRLHADAAVEGSGVSYLDIELDPYVLGASSFSKTGFITGELLPGRTELERNIAINNGEMLTVNIIAMDGGFNSSVSDAVKLGLNAALDLFGISAVERYSDGLSGTGVSFGGAIEATADIVNHFRLVLGVSGKEMFSGATTYNNGYDCSYYDPYYGYYTYQPCTSTSFDQIHGLGKTYFSLQANLTKNLKLFGVADYAVYNVSSDTGAVDTSHEGRFQFRFGGSVRVP